MQMHPLQQRAVRAFSWLHTGVYRLLGGRGVVAKNTLILTTRGRKTGRESSTPLLYVRESTKLYIVASFGGSDTPPRWFLNLQANPEVGVEVGQIAGRYRARPLPADEAKPIWPKLLAMYPAYQTYQTKTARQIPVVELSPLAG
jgi:deazaflavin-dependent oxidoreductase (nitroreductase family)